MKTFFSLACAAALSLLLAPVVHAGVNSVFRPASFAVMAGGNFPDEGDRAAGGECFFVVGFTRNRFFGYQFEFDATNYSGNLDDETGTFYAIAASLRLSFPIAFVEPYVLGGAGVGIGAPGASENTSSGLPLHAAAGIDFNFGKVLVGIEARQVWLTADGVDFDALLAMGKFGYRF